MIEAIRLQVTLILLRIICLEEGTMNLGDKIRDARKRNNYTQEQLANLVGVKKNTITGYEKNVREPSLEMVKKLAQTFGVSTDYLLGVSNHFDGSPELAEINEALDSMEKEIEKLRAMARTLAERKFADEPDRSGSGNCVCGDIDDVDVHRV